MRATLEIILLIFLLFVTAITAASEISIIAANRLKLKKMARGGSRSARIILTVLEAPERFFGAILVANNIVNTLIAVLLTSVIIKFVGTEGQWSLVLATAVASFLIIVSETTAKTFAAWNSEKIASILVRPVRALIFILSPIVRILEIITNIVVSVIGGRPKGKTALVTEEEIRALIKIGEEEGSLHKEKYKMLSKVFEFSDTVVKAVMTPKKDIVSININAHFDDIMERVLESGYSRLPVYKDNPENVIGVMNMKDLLSLSCNRDLIVLQDIVVPAKIVSESTRVTDLLKEFQKGHTHLAIVADSGKNISGIVTLEDLVEEIVGEIEDEYDIRSQGGTAHPQK